MSRAPLEMPEPETSSEPEDVKEVVQRSLITGAAVVIPLAVTLMVLGFVVNFLNSQLNPLIGFIKQAPVGPNQFADWQLKLLTITVLVGITFALGFVAEFSKRGTKLGDTFDEFMAAIPGLGSVYTSFDEMSEILLDSDTDSFQDVKLVEYPGEDSYTIAFKTSDTPSLIERTTGNEQMVTLFMPMAPNPVMGGFVIHVSEERVVDIDMTVEDGIRSIVTSGVAMGSESDNPGLRGLTEEEMRELGQIEQVEQQMEPGRESPDVRRSKPDQTAGRRQEYDESVSPEHSDTPQKIVERSRDQEREETEVPPAEMASRDADDREATGETPEQMSRRDERTRESTTQPPAEMGGRDTEEQAGDGETASPDAAAPADGEPSTDGETPGGGQTSADGDRTAGDLLDDVASPDEGAAASGDGAADAEPEDRSDGTDDDESS